MNNAAYLISIEPEDSPRRQDFFVQNCFDRASFKVFGVVGATLSAAEYYQAGVIGARLALTPSEVGCKESHLMALRHFLTTDAAYAWIFEDDARLKAGLTLDLQADLSAFASPVILSVGGVDRVHQRNLKGVLRPDVHVGQCNVGQGDVGQCDVLQVHPYFMSGVHGAYAYMVDRHAAQALLAFHQTPHLTDEWIVFCQAYPDIPFLMADLFAHPFPDDENFDSYINDERTSKHQTLEPKLAWFQIIHRWVAAWWFKTKRSYIRKKLHSYPIRPTNIRSEP